MEKKELVAGKVLCNSKTGEKHRILYVNWEENVIFVIEIGQNIAYPEALNAENICNAEMEIHQESNLVIDTSAITDKQKEEMESRWKLIRDFVLSEPECYHKKVRSTFAAKAAEQEQCTIFRINQMLYRYWAGGKSKTALIPDTSLRGGRGKAKTGSVGRKPKYDSDKERYVMTEADVQKVRRAVDKTYNKNRKYSFVDGYVELLKSYKKDDGITLLDSYPSKSQFLYRAKQMIDIKNRYGTRTYTKDIKGHLGSSKNEARGPGDKYQVDATIGDIYLVSAADPRKVIGRPTVYLVTDVYSRAIVGIYVGLENPSWKAARKALFNAFRDKVEYCKYFGIDIEESEWPCRGVPHSILADNGEFNSFQSDDLVAGLGVSLENTAPWRADQKGIVEQSFHQINLLTKARLPGAVISPVHTRGDEDYKAEARLTLYEYTQVLIRTVLFFNSNPLSRQPIQDQDYIEEGLLPIPNEIWMWGMENRTGGLSIKADEELWLALLPRVQASITKKGIRHKNLYFSCNTAGLENWFDSVGGRVREKCTLIVDPDNMHMAYVILPSGRLERAVRTGDSGTEYQHWTEEDLDLYISAEKERRSKHTRKTDQKKQDYLDAVERIVQRANVRFDEAKVKSKKQTGTQIKENRKAEKKIVQFPQKETVQEANAVAKNKAFSGEDSQTVGDNRSNALNKKLKKLMDDEE